MTIQEIRTLPVTEKLQIMDTIWQDMREHFEAGDPSPEVIVLLRDRHKRVEQGMAKLLDWDEVKSSIGRG